jgi:DNA end-binding protein Ku
MATDARSIASLTISFGLVAIPVKLYSATIASERISFNLLHQKDGSRLKQQYVCAAEGKVVDRSEIVKGYEFAKDQYVMFTPAEIKALEEAGSPEIAIEEFVPLDSVDPVYFDKTYYLTPDKGGPKPYTLLTTALREAKRCAIGRWAARGREHIVVIRAIESGLAMHQLHFQAEVRTIGSMGIEPSQVTDAELKLARQLIEAQTAKRFEPSSYVDEFRGRVEAAIQKKVEGKEISLSETPAAAPSRNVIDLMEVLRQSIEARGAKATDDLKARKPPKRAAKSAAARKSSRG